MGNQLSKPHHLWDCHRLYNIIYQSSNCHSQQYINYHCKNNLLYYCSLCSHNSAISFLHKNDWSQTCFHFIPLSNKGIAICMRMHTRGHQMMVIETSKTTNFWAHFFYNMFLYWLTIPFISIIFFYWQAFARWVKATNKATVLLALFFYNTIIYW